MERYGWDEHKQEGLAELARIKSSRYFSGEDDLILLIREYIKFYENDEDLRTEITGRTFYPGLYGEAARKEAKNYLSKKALQNKTKKSLLGKDAEDKATSIYLRQAEMDKKLKEKFEKPARDKLYRGIKKLRQFIESFYDTPEGKESTYDIFFVAEERDYRLGIRPAEIRDKNESFLRPRPVFVIVGTHVRIASEDERWLYRLKEKYPLRAEIAELTVRNVGADITWVKIDSQYDWLILDYDPQAMPTNAEMKIKLNVEKVREIFGWTKEDWTWSDTSFEGESSPVIILFRYYTSQGLIEIQAYEYFPWGGLVLQS